MPNSITASFELRELAVTGMVLGLLTGSAIVWAELFRRRRANLPWIDLCEEPRSDWRHHPEQLAVMIALLSFGLHLISRLSSAPTQPLPVTPISGLWSIIAVYGGTTAALLALLGSSGPTAMRTTGVKCLPLGSQLRDGGLGFLLAILPMACSMALAAPLRTPDSQNTLLRLLADSPSTTTIVLIVISAAVIAPLSEEMIYRVLLQGWLTTRLPPRVAIPLVAGAFCSVHGPVDGLTLIPLALVLGWVFHQRHSYLAVVVIHSLFNATMLALQLLTTAK